MALNDVHEVVLSYSIGSVPVLNVLHVRESTSIVLTDSRINAEAIAEAIIASPLMTMLLDCISTDAIINSVNVRRILPAPDVPYHRVLGAAEALEGTRAGQVVPTQACLLVSLYSNEPGRSGRGRIYVPGVSETDQNEGKLLQSFFNAQVGALTNELDDPIAMTGADTGEVRLAIYSRTLGQANDVLTATAQPNLATQRSRRAREGFGD